MSVARRRRKGAKGKGPRAKGQGARKEIKRVKGRGPRSKGINQRSEDRRQKTEGVRLRDEDCGRLPVAKELGETSLMFLVHPTLRGKELHDTVAINGLPLIEVPAVAYGENQYSDCSMLDLADDAVISDPVAPET